MALTSLSVCCRGARVAAGRLGLGALVQLAVSAALRDRGLGRGGGEQRGGGGAPDGRVTQAPRAPRARPRPLAA